MARGARVTRPTRRAPREARRKDASPGVEAWLDQHGVTQVKIAGVDLDGVLRGKYVSRDKFRSISGSGLGFCDVVFGWDIGDELYDNAQVTGWHTGYPDLHARVDLDSRRLIPWEPATAAFLLDFVEADGTDYGPSPRGLLRRVGARARAMGFLPKFGSEYEFFIFKETPASLRAKAFTQLEPLTPGMFGYSWLRTSQNSELVHALLDGCNAFGLELEGFHTETGHPEKLGGSPGRPTSGTVQAIALPSSRATCCHSAASQPSAAAPTVVFWRRCTNAGSRSRPRFWTKVFSGSQNVSTRASVSPRMREAT